MVRGETRSGVLNRYLASPARRALLKALASMPVLLGGVLPAWAAKTAPRARLISSKVCVVMPETTEGPFYVDPDLVRADITEGKAGVPVELLLQVVTADCEPVKDARVDVWHCDAEGNYSGFGASGSGSKAFLRAARNSPTPRASPASRPSIPAGIPAGSRIFTTRSFSASGPFSPASYSFPMRLTSAYTPVPHLTMRARQARTPTPATGSPGARARGPWPPCARKRSAIPPPSSSG